MSINNISEDYNKFKSYVNSINFTYKGEEIKYSKVISILKNKFGEICFPKSKSIIREDCLRLYNYEILDYHPMELMKLKVPFPLICFLRESHDRRRDPYFYSGKTLQLELVITSYFSFTYNNFPNEKTKYSKLYIIKSFLVFTNYIINNVKITQFPLKQTYDSYVSMIYIRILPIFKSKLISYFNFQNCNLKTLKFHLKPLDDFGSIKKIIFDYAFEGEFVKKLKIKMKNNMRIFDSIYNLLYLDINKRNSINSRLQLEYFEYRSDIYNEKKLLGYMNFLDLIDL